VQNTKGGLSAPFFYVALVLAGAGSYFGLVALWAAAVAMLTLAASSGETAEWGLSWLSLAVVSYAFAVMLSALATSPAYTPAGLYHPLILLLAYTVLRSCSNESESAIAYAACGLALMIAVWGLIQIGPFKMARAQAFFETPATYSAVLILLLVPVLAGVVAGRRHAVQLGAAAVLAAAVFAAQSRGALLALAASMGSVAILGLRAQLINRRGMALAILLLAAGWIGAALLRASPAPDVRAVSDEARSESSISRLELYALAWNARHEHPIAGTGYLTFHYALEQGRAQVPSYGDSNQTWFVHNDYLQTLLELGPIGLIAFLGLTALPPVLAYRRIPGLADRQRFPVVATASALAAMSVHALVDFPFYIPVCLMLYGALLGALDRRLFATALSLPPAWRSRPGYRPARAALLTIAAVVLLRPVAAETAAFWGLRKSAVGDAQATAFWIGAAQRLDPGDWRYHWYAGQLWERQAMQSGKRDAARRAAEAYAAGFAANPVEVRNLLGKISVHSRLRALLDSPADRGTVQAWQARAEELAPLNRDVRSERALLGAAK
jgi:O-antigen ligase